MIFFWERHQSIHFSLGFDVISLNQTSTVASGMFTIFVWLVSKLMSTEADRISLWKYQTNWKFTLWCTLIKRSYTSYWGEHQCLNQISRQSNWWLIRYLGQWWTHWPTVPQLETPRYTSAAVVAQWSVNVLPSWRSWVVPQCSDSACLIM